MSYRAEFNNRGLFGYAWESNSLRYATEAEAQASMEAVSKLVISTGNNDGMRVVECAEPVNARWDFEAGRYSPIAVGKELTRDDEEAWMQTIELYETRIKCHGPHALGAVLRAAEMNLSPSEWSVSENGMTVIFHGEAAKRIGDEAHRQGIKLRGWTQEHEVDE